MLQIISKAGKSYIFVNLWNKYVILRNSGFRLDAVEMIRFMTAKINGNGLDIVFVKKKIVFSDFRLLF